MTDKERVRNEEFRVTGDEVLSGSFVAAGSGLYRATRVGADS